MSRVTTSSNPIPQVKPKLRGVIHQVAFFCSLITGPLLVIFARAGDQMQALVYSFSLSGLFGASALYHRPFWKRTRVRAVLRRIDHAMIFVLIAGTLTPIALGLGTQWARTVMIATWTVGVIGIVFNVFWIPPKVLTAPIYMAMGWMGLLLMIPAYRRWGAAFILLLAVGGVLYSIGALAYMRGKPNPKPGVFGYHEFFHTFVTAAALCHYGAVLMVVR